MSFISKLWILIYNFETMLTICFNYDLVVKVSVVKRNAIEIRISVNVVVALPIHIAIMIVDNFYCIILYV